MSESIFCPHCLKYTSIDSVIITTGTSIGGNQVTTSGSWYDSKRKVSWSMKKCNSCQEVVLLKNDGEKIYPSPQPSPTDSRIIDSVRCDLEESKLCFSVSAFNATAVLARRAIQSLCIDKGADKKKNLFQQIKQLNELGIITNDLKNWATEVRYVGNEGAHPGEVVEKENAEAILNLTEQLAQVIYVMPAMAKELKEKREEKSQ